MTRAVGITSGYWRVSGKKKENNGEKKIDKNRGDKKERKARKEEKKKQMAAVSREDNSYWTRLVRPR